MEIDFIKASDIALWQALSFSNGAFQGTISLFMYDAGQKFNEKTCFIEKRVLRVE